MTCQRSWHPPRLRAGSRAARVLRLGAGLLALGAACTFSPSAPSSFSETLELYAGADGKKALALAAEAEEGRGRSAWGVFTGSLTQGHANQKALEACADNARGAGVEAPCHLFAEGDAPARETRVACLERRIGAYRCALQTRYAGALAGPGE